MQHHIIVKWVDNTDKQAVLQQVTQLYADACSIEGVEKCELIPNVIDRPNRYDLMIRLTMARDALPVWDASDLHKRWKADFGALVAQKTIFDCD